ncbi:hypothetical protein B0H17DRAFT_123603 [Mycena rosella]|uniref:Uncharacterized protein n=1 Tax=Mycena rosella TaxID=1033263 RepID=A0AAD7AWT9_MYCRO|nr:hypothetical protein B0H17DRAFT_123603 [Mycena rosella]
MRPAWITVRPCIRTHAGPVRVSLAFKRRCAHLPRPERCSHSRHACRDARECAGCCARAACGSRSKHSRADTTARTVEMRRVPASVRYHLTLRTACAPACSPRRPAALRVRPAPQVPVLACCRFPSPPYVLHNPQRIRFRRSSATSPAESKSELERSNSKAARERSLKPRDYCNYRPKNSIRYLSVTPLARVLLPSVTLGEIFAE